MAEPRQYRNPYTELAKALRSSLALKRKAGWSRIIGAGFVAEDIADAFVGPGERVFFTFQDGRKWVAAIPELNLRETEELIIWAEAKDASVDLEAVRPLLPTQEPEGPPYSSGPCEGMSHVPIHVPHSGHRPAGHRCGEGHLHCFRCIS